MFLATQYGLPAPASHNAVLCNHAWYLGTLQLADYSLHHTSVIR